MQDFFSSHPRHRLAPDLTIAELRELFEAMKAAEEKSTKDIRFRGVIVRGAVLPRIESAKHCWETRKAETASDFELRQQKLAELDALRLEVESYASELSPMEQEENLSSEPPEAKGKKTPAELLAMHERDPSKWTQLSLAKAFYDGDGDRSNENTLRNWTKKQWEKAKKERQGAGQK
jgi:hypothetical protein